MVKSNHISCTQTKLCVVTQVLACNAFSAFTVQRWWKIRLRDGRRYTHIQHAKTLLIHPRSIQPGVSNIQGANLHIYEYTHSIAPCGLYVKDVRNRNPHITHTHTHMFGGVDKITRAWFDTARANEIREGCVAFITLLLPHYVYMRSRQLLGNPSHTYNKVLTIRKANEITASRGTPHTTSWLQFDWCGTRQ